MDDNNMIVGQDVYALLGANPVKLAILQNAFAESNPFILDENDEYKNICQALGTRYDKGSDY